MLITKHTILLHGIVYPVTSPMTPASFTPTEIPSLVDIPTIFSDWLKYYLLQESLSDSFVPHPPNSSTFSLNAHNILFFFFNVFNIFNLLSCTSGWLLIQNLKSMCWPCAGLL